MWPTRGVGVRVVARRKHATVDDVEPMGRRVSISVQHRDGPGSVSNPRPVMHMAMRELTSAATTVLAANPASP
jgi:hypothetical protein